MEDNKPAFDPNKPFAAVEEQKPAFDPNKPFEPVDLKKKDDTESVSSDGTSNLEESSQSNRGLPKNFDKLSELYGSGTWQLGGGGSLTSGELVKLSDAYDKGEYVPLGDIEQYLNGKGFDNIDEYLLTARKIPKNQSIPKNNLPFEKPQQGKGKSVFELKSEEEQPIESPRPPEIDFTEDELKNSPPNEIEKKAQVAFDKYFEPEPYKMPTVGQFINNKNKERKDSAAERGKIITTEEFSTPEDFGLPANVNPDEVLTMDKYIQMETSEPLIRRMKEWRQYDQKKKTEIESIQDEKEKQKKINEEYGTPGRYLLGITKSIGESMGRFMDVLDGAASVVGDIPGVKEVFGEYNHELSTVGDMYRDSSKELPKSPDTFTGRATSNIAGMSDFFLSMALTPQAKIGGMIMKMPQTLGAMGFLNTYSDLSKNNPEELNKIAESFKAMGEGVKSGVVMTAIGIPAGQFGELISKSMKAAPIDKAIAGGLTTATANAIGFGGMTLVDQYGATGKFDINDPEVAKSAELGFILGMGDLPKLIFAKALNDYLSVKKGFKDKIEQSDINVEAVREKSIKLSKMADNEPDIYKKQELILASKAAWEIANVKGVSNVVSKNPRKAKELINNDQTIPPEQKEVINQKITETIQNTDPTIKETAPVEEKVQELNKEAEFVQNEPAFSETAKKAKLAKIEEEKKALEETVIKKEVKNEPKEEKGKGLLTEQPIEKVEELPVEKKVETKEEINVPDKTNETGVGGVQSIRESEQVLPDKRKGGESKENTGVVQETGRILKFEVGEREPGSFKKREEPKSGNSVWDVANKDKQSVFIQKSKNENVDEWFVVEKGEDGKWKPVGEPFTKRKYLIDNILKGGQNESIQERSSEEILPRKQNEITGTGGERSGVGQGEQGEEVAKEGKKEINSGDVLIRNDKNLAIDKLKEVKGQEQMYMVTDSKNKTAVRIEESRLNQWISEGELLKKPKFAKGEKLKVGDTEIEISGRTGDSKNERVEFKAGDKKYNIQSKDLTADKWEKNIADAIKAKDLVNLANEKIANVGAKVNDILNKAGNKESKLLPGEKLSVKDFNELRDVVFEAIDANVKLLSNRAKRSFSEFYKEVIKLIPDFKGQPRGLLRDYFEKNIIKNKKWKGYDEEKYLSDSISKISRNKPIRKTEIQKKIEESIRPEDISGDYKSQKWNLKVSEILTAREGKEKGTIEDAKKEFSQWIKDNKERINSLAPKLTSSILNRVNKVKDMESMADAIDYVDRVLEKKEFRDREIKKQEIIDTVDSGIKDATFYKAGKAKARKFTQQGLDNVALIKGALKLGPEGVVNEKNKIEAEIAIEKDRIDSGTIGDKELKLAQEKIENLERKKELYDEYGDVASKSLSELTDIEEQLKSDLDTFTKEFKDQQAEIKAERDKEVEEFAIEQVGGEENLLDVESILPKKTSWFKKYVAYHDTLSSLMKRMLPSSIKYSGSRAEKLIKGLTDANPEENRIRKKLIDEKESAIRRFFGSEAKYKNAINKRADINLDRAVKDKDGNIEVDEDGNVVFKKIPKKNRDYGTLLHLWLSYKSEGNNPYTTRIMSQEGRLKLSEDEFNRIGDLLPDNLKNFGDWVVQEFIPGQSAVAQKAFFRQTGRRMPSVADYLPVNATSVRSKTGIDNIASLGLIKSIFKKRAGGEYNLEDNNIDNILSEFIDKYSKQIALSEPVANIDRIINNPRVKQILKSKGKGVYRDYMNDMLKVVLGENERMETLGLEGMYRRFVLSNIRMNYMTVPKQLIQVFSTVEYVSAKDMLESSVRLSTNKKSRDSAIKILRQAAGLDLRQIGFIESNARTGKVLKVETAINDIADRMDDSKIGWAVKVIAKSLWNPSQEADRTTIQMGGIPLIDAVYNRKMKEYMMSGMDKRIANHHATRDALTTFHDWMNETQQSAESMYKSKAQTGGWKFAIPYLNAQMAYARKIMGGYKEMYSAYSVSSKKVNRQYPNASSVEKMILSLSKMDKKEASNGLKKVLLYQVVIPHIFQAVASGGRSVVNMWSDDEKKRMQARLDFIIRDTALSWTQGFTIFGALGNYAYDATTGRTYGRSSENVMQFLENITSLWNSGLSAIKGEKKRSDALTITEEEKAKSVIRKAYYGAIESAFGLLGLPTAPVHRIGDIDTDAYYDEAMKKILRLGGVPKEDIKSYFGPTDEEQLNELKKMK